MKSNLRVFFFCEPCFWCYRKNLCLTQDHKDNLLCSSRSSITLALVHLCFWVDLWSMVWGKSLCPSVCGVYPTFPSPFVGIFSPLNCLDIFVENQLTINMKRLYSDPLTYISILILLSHYLDDNSFITAVESGSVNPPTLFFFKTSFCQLLHRAIVWSLSWLEFWRFV